MSDWGAELAGEFMTFAEFSAHCDELTERRRTLSNEIKAFHDRCRKMEAIAAKHFEDRVFVKDGHAYVVRKSNIGSGHVGVLDFPQPEVCEFAPVEIVDDEQAV